MIYLRTGANGAGKTLLTLRDVHAMSVKESRPVYYNGRFKMAPDGPLKNWQLIDAKDWQKCPDGSIFLFDECHNDFPVRPSSAPVPEHVRMLAEHRSRGFDFFLITQHPGNFDKFIRNLIGSPGWHQHLKRASGAPLVSVLQWAAVNDQPQKNGSGASAQVSMVPYPKEVYGWYQSTSLDTAKVKIPFQLKVIVASFFLVPALVYLGYQQFSKLYKPKQDPSATAADTGPGVSGAFAASQNTGRGAEPLTTAQYVASYTPRIEGLPQTAPRYDEITKPIDAPYPAACLAMGDRCDCYSQQATKLQVPKSLCVQIVKGGFFQDWQGALKQASTPGAAVPVAPVAVSTESAAGARPVASVDLRF